jgi:two-component system sensor histidine kinase HydH
MFNNLILKLAAPMILTSAMLVVLGVVAAWNIERQQNVSSDLIQKEVHGMIAAQDLCSDLREIRYTLHQYRHDGFKRHLEVIARRSKLAAEHLEAAKGLIRLPREAEAVLEIEKNWRQFSSLFVEVLAELSQQPETSQHPSDGSSGTDFETSVREEKRRVSQTEPLLTAINHVLVPAKDFLALDRILVDKTNESNRQTTDAIRQAMLWVGICGGIAGLVGGIAIARSIGQSVVQLDVSVRGAADRLQDVIGPVKISQRNGFRGLEAGLRQLEDHISTLVERLQQRELEVLRSDQLAAVGQLAAGVAHELRNPLMPMKMLVQAAVERADGIGLCGRPLQVVEKEILRMEKSIQDFLDFARPPSLEIIRFDLRNTIEQTIDLVSSRADQQQVEIFEEIPSGPVVLQGDAAQIRQVLLNLLLNSMDALREGGLIELRVTFDSPPLADHRSSLSKGTSWVAIHVRDSGAGLSKEVLDRVFEPFMSTKETGTGLGLSICRRIVEAHQGIIRAANHPGGGALFSVYLPVPPYPVKEMEQLSLVAADS